MGARTVRARNCVPAALRAMVVSLTKPSACTFARSLCSGTVSAPAGAACRLLSRQLQEGVARPQPRRGRGALDSGATRRVTSTGQPVPGASGCTAPPQPSASASARAGPCSGAQPGEVRVPATYSVTAVSLPPHAPLAPQQYFHAPPFLRERELHIELESTSLASALSHSQCTILDNVLLSFGFCGFWCCLRIDLL